ncbi:uncharacterized protein F4822DRAFT_441689 [Hypoxylon trugodes]|uniref:uncharacterized protein n=1 Tax=Hypoxylon trugodes TaxID=326681 RepID=UPI0021915F69|nr:uncharacterized protein F4822DRAFT_441689 [Hypoxylon trugodes]KAI1392946.1 hypothetical protein F4822DRAFT_441689 [Hypoxylon trugodes]
MGSPNEATLSGMPSELQVRIMGELDIDSVRRLSITNKRLREVCRTHEKYINFTILQNVINSLPKGVRPFAVALYAANHTDWKAQWPLPSLPELYNNIHTFGRRYLDRNNWRLPIERKEATLKLVSEMIPEILSFHAIVEEWTLKFMNLSLSKVERHEGQPPMAPPSISEITRIQQAFYIREIARELFPFFIGEPGPEGVNDMPFDMFWHYFAPWENQIVAGIDEFFHLRYNEIYLAGELSPTPQGWEAENYDDFVNELGGWFIKYGLRHLHEINDWDTLINSMKEMFEEDEQYDPRPFRKIHYSVNIWAGCTWLRPTEHDITIRTLGIDHLMQRFTPGDSGPIDSWFFHFVYESTTESPLIQFPTLADTDSRWWDRARIEATFPNAMPTMEDIQIKGTVEKAGTYDAGPYVLSSDPDFCKEIGY